MRTPLVFGLVALVLATSLVLGACGQPKKLPRTKPAEPPAPTAGKVTVNCEPADAEVFIDGQRQGTVAEIEAKGSLTVPFGLHRFEIRHPSHMTFRLELSIGEKPETINIKLTPRGEAAP